MHYSSDPNQLSQVSLNFETNLILLNARQEFLFSRHLFQFDDERNPICRLEQITILALKLNKKLCNCLL